MSEDYPDWILKLAKKLDTPKMRELYRSQKVADASLEERVEELSQEIQQIFKHDKDSQNGNKTGKKD